MIATKENSLIVELRTFAKLIGAEGRLRANNHINFAKQLVLTYPDTSIEVSENELNELWKKTM